ncbi:MAG: S9 family peptidase [Terriglobia bacterium]
MKRINRRDFAKAAAGSLGCVAITAPTPRSSEEDSLNSAFAAAPATEAEHAAPADLQEATELGRMLHRVFADKEFTAKSFGPARWLNDGEAYTTLEPSAGSGEEGKQRDIVRYETSTGQRKILVSASQLVPRGASAPMIVDDYAWSKDMKRLLIFTNSHRVWRQNTRGDYWTLGLDSGRLQKLGGDLPPSTLMFAKFSPDGARVAYVHANNIYVEDVVSGAITPLTKDGSATLINGTSDWVNEEELDIRDGFKWSPDGARIAFWQFDTSRVGDFPLIYNTGGPYDVVSQIPYPDYGVYPFVKHIAYPETGTTNSAVRVGVVSAAGGTPQWMEAPGDPREHYIARMNWAEGPQELVLQHLNRLQNTNDVLLADASTGKVRCIYRDHDAAWVDVYGDVKWQRDGAEFLWVSERDGWRHIYVISRDGQRGRLVTPGAFDVIELLHCDKKGEWVYYLASPENATQAYLFRSPLDNAGPPQRLTPAGAAGTHKYDISPGGAWAFHTYSNFDAPPVTSLVRLPAHQTERVLEGNAALQSKVRALTSEPVQFFPVDIGGGVSLDSWMIRPQGFDPGRKYPLLIYVYGGPAAQTVLDEWGGDRMLFHRLLANEGYLVASVDNRGTPAPKGRAWRKFVFGSIDGPVSADQSAALQALLRSRPYIDANRVAVWGWSGGGSHTLDLMFRYPNLYQTGMAVAPEPDWRLYDTIYQERYMRLPQDNMEGYRSGSPINFAQGLRGNLLLVHGSDDDNVHIQGTQLLMNRLVELGKQFDFMEYPGRTHSLSEGPGTLVHLHSLLARHLMYPRPAGPVTRRNAIPRNAKRQPVTLSEAKNPAFQPI